MRVGLYQCSSEKLVLHKLALLIWVSFFSFTYIDGFHVCCISLKKKKAVIVIEEEDYCFEIS